MRSMEALVLTTLLALSVALLSAAAQGRDGRQWSASFAAGGKDSLILSAERKSVSSPLGMQQV